MTQSSIERIKVVGKGGVLEAVAENSVASGDRYAVVCHPHPLFGGAMDNKVVTTLSRAMHDAGMPTLRFNFRGVGASDGKFDGGDGETADAEAVACWGAVRWPGRRLVLTGFSFGAYVALRLAQRRNAAQLITIAPPVALFDFGALKPPACPWLIVQGDADELVDPRSVSSWVAELNPRPQLMMMPGVGHFFHGRLNELREAVRTAVTNESRSG